MEDKKTFAVSIPQTMHDFIRDSAEKNHQSMGAYVRQILRDHMARKAQSVEPERIRPLVKYEPSAEPKNDLGEKVDSGDGENAESSKFAI